MSQKIALYSQNVLLPKQQGGYTIVIKNKKIAAIIEGKNPPKDALFYDVGTSVVMPGIIDPHVHINEPGRTEWEGFLTGTAAAVAGGITTLVDMPLNASPVTTTAVNFEQKIKAAQQKLYTNCGFWGGLVPGNAKDLKALVKMGVLGFKAFLTHSGIDEFPNVSEQDLEASYQAIANTDLPVLAHCELSKGDFNQALDQQPTNYLAYLQSRPKQWENEAIRLMIRLAEKYQHPTHIVHISSADCLDEIRAAKKRGVPITVETCPHYLFFEAESIPNADTRFKCAPPIRESANNALLWQAVIDGTIDFIGSDHSPAPPTIKALESGDFKAAWGGISGIQYTLPTIWDKGQKFGLTLGRLKELLCESPALFVGKQKSKGKIKLGYAADLLVWNPRKWQDISSENMRAKHKISPYEGLRLLGKVEMTFVNGTLVFESDRLGEKRAGEMIFYRE